ncbi:MULTISPECIES: site-specific integrase [unclassified Bacillus (in: firmicutes)]|uniref:site-specific integrase n=1 Tax=unclassified Bacillus (in: firmicutes) TaxID=185979 RepID=UPI0008F1CFA5|nr:MULTISPECIES: site-specific integrase [unclassified Bacillus (in: firmicutes)]SFB25637.1 hypothetical protein SAMN02799634_1155 [Bacillus sp. UNCCL13]SFQ91789.1 hypothetical protein SAMN04488577_0169 [Bacillus sp. cl95]
MALETKSVHITSGQTVDLISIETRIFNTDQSTFEEYEQLFQNWASARVILAKSFSDTKWILTDKDQNNRTLVFDIEIYKKLNLALKCWALSLINEEYSINHIQSVIHTIKEVIQITKGLNTDYLSDLEDLISTSNYAKQDDIATYLRVFFNFTEFQDADEFLDLCSQFSNNIQKSRALPFYSHVLFFDEKTEEFINEASEDEKKRFFPIILWWKITSIIPLRPIEFLKTKRQCNYQKNDSYFLEVSRKKEKATSNREIDITDTVKINKEIFDLIEEFKNGLLPEDDSDYLITYKYYEKYKTFFGSDFTKQVEFLPRRQFDSLIDQYYREILKKKYYYTGKDKISPGDTRHFAFCNMMLQGFNMLTIARIGGHKRLDKQQHYWGHLEYFAQSWVYNLSEKHRRFKIIDKKLPQANFTEENRKVLMKYKLYQDKDFSDYLPVDFGYCLNLDFPFDCPGECRHCKFYQFHPKEKELNKGSDWLLDYSLNLQRKINERVSYLQYLSHKMKYDLPNLKYSIVDQEELSSASNELNRFLLQKSIVDSHIPKNVDK